MKEYINTIYLEISNYLINVGYSPILLKNQEDSTETLLFIDYSENIIFSISLEKIDNTLYLFEGSLFDERDKIHNISCEFYRACSIHYNISTGELIRQFKSNFEQFIIDGKEFIQMDSKVDYPEMKSGIFFENPQNAITEFAKQNNLKIVI